MVQRKVPPTLQPHQTDSHEIKPNKGPALKKMMKKSGSIKRPKTTPNYMKPTSSSDARKEQVSPRNNSSSSGKKGTKTLLSRTLTKSPSFKPARASARKCSPSVFCESFDAQRATCSSTLKDSKFPAYLSLNHGGSESDGTSSVKVCPYTYCSLNGHHHPPLPPLKCFLKTRRSMIKNQRSSIKMGSLSVKPVVEDGDIIDEEKKDFFVEIYAKKDEDSNIIDDAFDAADEAGLEAVSEQNEEVEADEEIEQNEEVKVDEEEVEDSDMEWEIGYDSSLNLDCDYEYDYEYSSGKDMEPDPDENGIIKDEFVGESGIKDCCFDEFLVDEVAQESYAESLNSDAYSSSDDGEHLESHCVLLGPSSDESSHQSLTSKDAIEPEMEDSGVVRITANSKKPVEDSEELGTFNPRGPNFLPLEPDKEAEKVDLKHQDLDERRNSEEWMVDYALRQVVTKLGPDRKRKVSLLVEAFEKVMPITKCDVHLRQHGSGFDQARPMQACS